MTNYNMREREKKKKLKQKQEERKKDVWYGCLGRWKIEYNIVWDSINVIREHVNCPSIHQYSRVLVKCIIKQQLNGSFKYNELSFLSLFLSFLFLFLHYSFHSLRYFTFWLSPRKKRSQQPRWIFHFRTRYVARNVYARLA